jgi:hypothetical protein
VGVTINGVQRGLFNASGLTVTGAMTATSLVGPLTGNALTATTLATSRSINGVSFNGSADIVVSAAASGLTGNTLAPGVTASSLTSFGASIALGTPASGNLANCSFPTLNQNTTGSAATAGYITNSAYNGYGARTVSTSAPSGGSDGDVWYVY